MSREFEIAVFGATGYTGEKIVQYLARGPLRNLQKAGKKIALAGRRPAALKEVSDRAVAAAGDQSLSSAMEIVSADVSDTKTLDSLCARSRLLINCVGPFRFYGEPVVQACVSQGTHYVDITGEPEFIETMMLKYDAEAKAKKILLIPSCGFDSLPADLGHVFASQQFLKAHPDGAVSSMECFLGGTAPNGVQVHYATWESAVHGFANAHKLRSVRKQLRARQSANNAVTVPRVGPKLNMPSYYFEKRLNKWCVPFPGSDASVVANTQCLEAEETKGTCPPQPHYAEYFAFESVLTLMLLMLIGVFFKLLTGFEWGRQMLLKHSGLLSLGFVSHAGPSQKILDTATFSLTYFVRGYAKKPAADAKDKPDTEMKVVVSGPEPGYVTCSIVVSQAALTILELEQAGKLERVGVLTPGFALGNTDLPQKLTAEHVLFSVAQ